MGSQEKCCLTYTWNKAHVVSDLDKKRTVASETRRLGEEACGWTQESVKIFLSRVIKSQDPSWKKKPLKYQRRNGSANDISQPPSLAIP